VDKENNVYTIGYAVVMTLIVAVSLAFVSTSWKEKQDFNQQLATKMDILKAVGLADVEKAEAASLFDDRIESLVLSSDMKLVEGGVPAVDIDMFKETKLDPKEQRYPLYVYRHDGQTRYIIPMYGNGLWDKIWGYVALKEDMATIAGISMDHKAETPGLGAEIKDNPKDYNEPFVGKSIYNADGQYVSVAMKKGKLDDPDHQIDGITGATITSDGVNEMLYQDIQAYLPYFNQLKNAQ
jgi:Na+-transporting NADH:ubiquinone oxidoreductase subunit C